MSSIRHKSDGRRPSRGAALLVLALLGTSVVGCDALIDVENPNNVTGDDLTDPAAAAAVSNGALYTVQDGYNYMLLVYEDVADELTWVGSRDAFQELDFGTPGNPGNEFTDQAFVKWAVSLWMVTEAIEILEQHQADGVLDDVDDLAKAYLYAAMTRVTTADFMDDVTFSDRKLAGPPVGPAMMGSLYTTALGWIDAGLAIASDADLVRNLTAMRARTLHSQARWNMIGQVPISVTNTGLISSSAAATWAQNALNLDNSDWTFDLLYSANTAFNVASFAINSRLELRFSDDYIIPSEPERKIRDRDAADNGISLADPVTGVGDARLDAFMTPFEDADNFATLPYLSAREMRLIIAEDELATNGNNATFQGLINDVRSDGGVPDWDGVTPAGRDILIHERRVNLFMMGHRLSDMYRFGIQSTNWQATSPAATTPGVFLPITITERDANCFLNSDFECGPGDTIGGGGQ